MISQLAYIATEAKLGENVTVGPFAYIEADVVIGDNCIIESGAKIMNGARIGKGCHIHPGAVVSGIPQDLKFKGEVTTCEIGDGTMIRECATINRGTVARGKTVVGSNCLIMAYAHVAHDCIIGNRVILVNSAAIAGEVEIGDWAIVSGLVAVHQFVKIGAHAMISGGSFVTKDVPPYIIAAHENLQYQGLNVIGLRRRGFSSDDITTIQNIYRILFQSGLNTTNAVAKIKEEHADSKYATEILDFIAKSERGLIRAYQSSTGQ